GKLGIHGEAIARGPSPPHSAMRQPFFDVVVRPRTAGPVDRWLRPAKTAIGRLPLRGKMFRRLRFRPRVYLDDVIGDGEYRRPVRYHDDRRTRAGPFGEGGENSGFAAVVEMGGGLVEQ